MVHQSKDKVFKFMFDGFPQELLYYFNVNEIFVEFLETEFIDQNGNKKVLECIQKLPPQRILCETDAPFQYLKGEKFTSPADITKIQKRILELLEKNDCNHS